MEALVPAFIAALLTQASDRSPWMAAILADRYGRPFAVTLAALIAHAGGNAIGAFGGMLLAPTLSPNAKALLLAAALLMVGFDGLWPLKPPRRLEHWRLGAFFTPLLGIAVFAAGDRTQFMTFAIAARAPDALLAAAGAAAGAAVVNGTAAYGGELLWRKLPLRAFRLGVSMLFLLTGAIVALGALRLLGA